MKKFSLLLPLLPLFLAACAGNPSLPSRQIDQPYTLPADTREFYFGAGFVHVKKGKEASTRLLLPLSWHLPQGDNWTWELLTAVRHQFYRTPTQTAGLRFGVDSLGYSTTSGWIIDPLASLYYKQLYSPNFALEHTLGGNYTIRTKRSDWNGWRAFLKNSAIFQLSDSTAISPGVTLAMEQEYFSSTVLRVIYLPEDRALFTVPLDLKFSWRLGLQWESVTRYEFDGIGHTLGFRAHSFATVMKHYW